MFLEAMDGCSCGSTAVTYRPMEFDGQRLISASLNSRTIKLSVSFSGKNGGLYSRSAALAHWNEIQRVFVPGQTGTLVWTDGVNSRTIKCRCSETPLPSEALPFLFRAAIQLTADRPLWYDGTENVTALESSSHSLTIVNDCGLAVPLIMEASATSEIFAVASSRGGGVAFGNTVGEGFVIDTDACTVISDSGELVNHLLSVESEFFKIMPGENILTFAGSAGVSVRWRKAYMGVY